MLPIGTDNGLRIIGVNGYQMVNGLTEKIGRARVRCIQRGTDDDLWVGTYSTGLGIVHLLSDGQIETYNTENGMPDNEVRCIYVQACRNKGQ